MSVPNRTTSGMATPYTVSSCSGVLTRTVFCGLRMVVKETLVPPTVAVYVVPYFSGCAGTHDELSGRSAPGTGVPPASASATFAEASAPARTTSAAAGTSVAPSAGALMDGPCFPGVDPAACHVVADAAEQPVSSAPAPSAAIAASTRAVVFNTHTPSSPIRVRSPRGRQIPASCHP